MSQEKRLDVNISFAIMEETGKKSICHYSSCRTFQAVGEKEMETKLKDTFKHELLPKAMKTSIATKHSHQTGSALLAKRRASFTAFNRSKVKRMARSKENRLLVASRLSNNSGLLESKEVIVSSPVSPDNSIEIPLLQVQQGLVDPRCIRSRSISHPLRTINNDAQEKCFQPQKVTKISPNDSGFAGYLCEEVSLVPSGAIDSSSNGAKTFDENVEERNDASLGKSESIKEVLDDLIKDVCIIEDAPSSHEVEISADNAASHNAAITATNQLFVDVEEEPSDYHSLGVKQKENILGVEEIISISSKDSKEHSNYVNVDLDMDSIQGSVSEVMSTAKVGSVTIAMEENALAAKSESASISSADVVENSPNPEEDIKVVDCSLSVCSNDTDPREWLDHICSPKNQNHLSDMIRREVKISSECLNNTETFDVNDSSELDKTIVRLSLSPEIEKTIESISFVTFYQVNTRAESSGASLFKDCYFLVTGGERPTWSKHLLQPAFEKDKLKTFIHEHGGVEIETITQDLVEKCKNKQIWILLIASNYTETAKYLQAIACGYVPCLHHTWMLKSIENDSLEPFQPYMLPRGWNTSESSVVHFKEHSPIGVFYGYKIAILRFSEPPVPNSFPKCAVIEDESNLTAKELSSQSMRWLLDFKHILQLAQAQVKHIQLLAEAESDVTEVKSFIMSLCVDYVVICEHSMPINSSFLVSLKQQCQKIVSKYTLLDMLVEGIVHRGES